MADDDCSPRPFRRERNLSSRNFNKRSSNHSRRFSTDSHSSVDSRISVMADQSQLSSPSNDDDSTASTSLSAATTPSSVAATGSSSMHISYSVNSDSEKAFNQKSLRKMRSLEKYENDEQPNENYKPNENYSAETNEAQHVYATNSILPSPTTPDPALMDVKQKVLKFENLKHDTIGKYKSHQTTQSLLDSERSYVANSTLKRSPRVPTKPTISSPLNTSSSSSTSSASSTSGSYILSAPRYLPLNTSSPKFSQRKSAFHNSIDEERSEDDVDSIVDEVNDDEISKSQDIFGEVVSQGKVQRLTSVNSSSSSIVSQQQPAVALNTSMVVSAISIKHSNSSLHHSISNESTGQSSQTEEQQEDSQPTKTLVDSDQTVKKKKDFPRNYRMRPKTEVLEIKAERQTDKFSSLHHKPKKRSNPEPEDEDEIELRDKGFRCIQPILDELIKTEESYVENLWSGIRNYGNIFERSDLPQGLRGKKYVLFGNIEQIAEFHRDEFLPMLQRNRHDLKRLFDEFQRFIDQNCLYGYVIFTMNKQNSLKLCDNFKNYFKHIQAELEDKLGINSFLVQPIQRMARYPLLMTQFMNTLFKNCDFLIKPVLESCCKLEKKLRNLLTTTNESEVINDIVCISERNEFNALYQGKFRKVSEFHTFDHTLKRSYKSKVFIFDKCIIYTEIKGKQLIFHGRYPCEYIGITAKTKTFTLFYQHRKMQECDFTGDPQLIEQWLELIKEMICSYAEEERRKIKESHSLEHGDHIHRKPANLALFRDSNRFSTDSGIGNIWVIPKPDIQDECTSNRTTWYAIT